MSEISKNTTLVLCSNKDIVSNPSTTTCTTMCTALEPSTEVSEKSDSHRAK